jgi:hypothetical protein
MYNLGNLLKLMSIFGHKLLSHLHHIYKLLFAPRMLAGHQTVPKITLRQCKRNVFQNCGDGSKPQDDYDKQSAAPNG